MSELPDSHPAPSSPQTSGSDHLRFLTFMLYVLYAIGLLTGGIALLVPVIVNYMKRSEVAGSVYAAHFTWQIRTFWCTLAGVVTGVALLFVLVGLPVLFAVFVWALYRIIKGWLYLCDDRTLASRAWF